MSKTKRLLSVTLASVMLFASAFSAFAEETEIEVETLSGTVTAEDVTVEPGVTKVTVPVTITFKNKQTSPHGMFDISADGATLKSAAFKTSDNSNFTADETVPDGAGLVDKSIYVNTENGRIIVESDVSEGMQPSVSYVTVEVVLKFTVALTEGEVITVDISNIAATNLSEASWDGMSAVNGTITVKAAETECDHDWEVVSADPAEADASYVQTKAGSIDLICSKCSNTKTEDVNYYLYYTAPLTAGDYASETSLVFSTPKSYFDMQGDHSNAFALFQHTLADDSVKETIIDVADAEDTTITVGNVAQECKSWYYGIKSIQMVDVVTANIFVEVNGAWYSGIPYSYSIRTYADSLFARSDIKDSEKTLVANLLTYGAKMQVYKNSNTDNLANANLGVYENYITTTDPVISAEIVQPDLTQAGSGVYIAAWYLDMADRIKTIYTFTPALYQGDNKDNYKVVATWKNGYGTDKSFTYYKDGSNVVDDITGAYVNSASFSGAFDIEFAGLDSFDLRQAVTFEIYDGESEVSQGFTASVEAIIAYGIAKGTYGDAEIAAYKAMLNYSDAAYAFFCQGI